nr:hypothetical protein BaRGS_009822 [Batillaria attramentaria]
MRGAGVAECLQANKAGGTQLAGEPRDVYERGDELSREHSQILSFISYTGCGMSLLALILTILTYCCCKRICRLNKPSKILISLCIALALSNLVFVAGMQNYALNNTTACKVVAMLLHFCLLSSMCWMSVEAFYVYLALVRVFRTRITHFILKASCFGWGAPLLIVSVTAGVHTLDNYAPLNSGMCWLRGVAFYSAFVAPVCLTLVFNFISFAFVLRTIVGLKHNKAGKAESSQSVQKLRRAVCVVVLLGLTWVFGFLAVDGATQIVFYYLFAVFNSLQVSLVG